MKNRWISALLLSVAACLLAGAGAAYWLQRPLELGRSAEPLDLSIPAGASARQVAQQLQQAGVQSPDWLLYGWLSHTLAILVTNGFGLVCALYYCSVFLTHDDDAERAKQRQQLSLVAFAVVVLAVFAAVDHVRATPLIGLVASSVSIAVFASPLAQLLNVVRSKSVAALSFPYAVASAVSSGLWSAFGLLAGDGNVYIPNIIAFMLSLAQLSLFLVFGRAAPTGKELAV